MKYLNDARYLGLILQLYLLSKRMVHGESLPSFLSYECDTNLQGVVKIWLLLALSSIRGKVLSYQLYH